VSKTQKRTGVKAVTEACKALMKLVRTISAKQVEKVVDYKNMAVLEFKKREMEQQVEIVCI
jgi:hypothetical protein